jgi:hypothetical protein
MSAAAGISVMRQTMDRQAEALAGILDDDGPVIAVAERLRGRRVLAIGTGTSWHAAGQAAVFLARTASRVHMLIRSEGLAATMSRYLIRPYQEAPPSHVAEFEYGSWMVANLPIGMRKAEKTNSMSHKVAQNAQVVCQHVSIYAV